MTNKVLVLFLILYAATTAWSKVPIKSSKQYLFILLHGEDGKDAAESYRIFTDNPNGGLKASLENTYGLYGYVYAYQMSKPSGTINAWTREFGNLSDSNSMLNRARSEHKDFLRKTWNITRDSALEALTPQSFIIIAHSYAGLVVRNYLCSDSYTGNIKMLITINTPHSGSDYPHILEVLETRTALSKLAGAAGKALKEVDPKGTIEKAVKTAYNLKKTYENIEEVVDDIKKYKEILERINARISAAQERLDQYGFGIPVTSMVTALTEAMGRLKPPSPSPPPLDISRLKQIRLACSQYADPAADNPLSWFYTSFDALARSGMGSADDVLSDVRNDAAIAQALFSPDDFSAAFRPDAVRKPVIGLPFPDYPSAYAEIHCAITRPVAFLSANPAALDAFRKVKTLRSCADSLSTDYEGISNLSFPAIDPQPLKDLAQNKIALCIADINRAMAALNSLGTLSLSAADIIPTCMKLLQTVETIKGVLGAMGEVQFYDAWDNLTATANDVRGLLAEEKWQTALANLEAIRRYEHALDAIKALQAVRPVNMTLNAGGVTNCNAVLSADFAPKAANFFTKAGELQTNYPADKLALAKSYVKLLSQTSVAIPPPDLSFPVPTAANPFNIPAPYFALEKSAVIAQSINDCASALKEAAGVYYDIKELADNIRAIMDTLKSAGDTSSGSEGKAPLFSSGDALSLVLLSMSVLKVLGPAENAGASSASFSATAQKVVKELLKELWKEIQNGAILEVGFAESARNATGVKASDPSMTAISNDGETIGALKNQMPENFSDTVLNQTKYRIIYTSGVLTPNKDGTKALDFVCGSGGTEALIRGKIEAAIEDKINEIKDSLAKKAMDAVMNLSNDAFKGLTNEARKALADGLKPGGNFAAAVDIAKKNGAFEAYRKIIEDQAGALIDVGAEALAKTLSKLGTDAVSGIIDKLKELDQVQKGMDFLDKLNPGLIVSMYKTVATADKSLTAGQTAFALYYSPLLKLGLYENGDFISTAQSQQGNDVLLFNRAQDVKRFQYKVNDPLSAFAGIAALGLALDVARYLAVEPGTAETIRLSKIAAVNILSIAAAVSRQEDIKQYFAGGHKAAVAGFSNPQKLDQLFFDKPYVSIRSPKGD